MHSDKDKLIMAEHNIDHLIKDIQELEIDFEDEFIIQREDMEDKGKNIDRTTVENAVEEFLKRGGKIKRG